MFEMKVLWLSRHEMGEDQRADMERTIHEYHGPLMGVSVEARNHTWAASADGEADVRANLAAWAGFFGEADIVAGVFPPAALEVLRHAAEAFEEAGGDPCVITPINRARPDLRADPTAQMPFEHVRWARLA